MKRDVLVTVTGLIFTGSGEDEKDYIDVITPGKYYFRDGKHVLLYEEMIEGCEDPVKNLLTITPDFVNIRKKGIVYADMLFSEGDSARAFYSTPFGALELETETKKITVTEGESEIRADIRYVMTVNGIQRNNCFVKILIQPAGDGSGFRVTKK